MVALRLKNEKLENLCRALHKGAKVTAGDISKVFNRYLFIYLFIYFLPSVVLLSPRLA